ncbi:MAG: LamG domain-containing protein, partial [Thaumarchaeota archaeon]
MKTNINYRLTFLGVIPTIAVLSIMLILNPQTVYSKNPEVSYLDVNDTSSVSKFSVAAWFKTSNDYKSDAYIVNKAGDGGNLNYGIWMTSAEEIRGGFESSSGKPVYATSPLSYSDGKWHYAVVTFDGSTLNLYVDGVQVDTVSASGSPDNGGSEPVRVGANSNNP